MGRHGPPPPVRENPKEAAMITRNTPAEAILDIPGVIAYCIAKGITPYTCSGDYTQSLGRLLELRDVADPEGFIAGLNRLAAKHRPR